MWTSDLPQEYERLEEYSDASPNGWTARRYHFADGTARTFERRKGGAQWTETRVPHTPPEHQWIAGRWVPNQAATFTEPPSAEMDT